MKQIAAILLIAATAGIVRADTVEVDETYFHPAASLYIHGDAAGASNLVATGLSLYPNDAKLKRLKDLLEQQEQEQQEQNNQDQQEQDQQDQQEQNNQDQQEQDEQQQEPNEPEEQDGQQQEPRPPEEMTPEEARQLLDAMKQEEKNERMQLRPILGNPVEVEKDW
jgi:Ca-activated chloride channel family protein